MTTTTRVAALGSEGWFTLDDPEPALLGMRCTTCATYVFPKAAYGCPNPACAGIEFDEVRLSRFGSVWSYTDACYQPPAPYVVPTDEHVPFCIAAVELADEGLVIMGQVVAGVTVDELTVGQRMELVVDVLYREDDTEHLIWKWKPVSTEGAVA
ncbi:Zn-ribbon domain-containing OB-fold protein [Aquihabitans sp. McL0605]|uniref:Zn-ribbon domain-containing OB-fold protein n=1 Tax=Aquihabitans sp. McL0605 TaxID=3415671 RepID=UPI003CEDA06B